MHQVAVEKRLFVALFSVHNAVFQKSQHLMKTMVNIVINAE